MLTTCKISFGQIYNPDPYKLDFPILKIEASKQEVIKNKIKKITSKEYEIKKDKSKKEIPKTDFCFIDFNKAGNPVHYRYKSYSPTNNPKDEISDTYDYYFEYDSLGNLIHVQENRIEFTSPEAHDENDIYYYYDKENKLINQTVSNKYIYTKGFKYRGTSYKNDTSIIKYTFNYGQNKVENVIIWRNDPDKWRNAKKSDTLVFNCSFDSIFIEKNIQKGIKKDSLGRIIETTIYAIHALLMDGGCISPDSPKDIIIKFTYNNNGKLIKSESKTRKGDFEGRQLWTYYDNGLLQSRQEEDSKQITIYEYEFY
ncbi:MAG: hypothetical protein WCO13_14425 [Bacteroidota bacterium]